MQFSDADIERRLRLGEDSAWEFKEVEFAGNRPSRDDWADEIAAFANARGGVLLCGVSDDGEAQGMSREQVVALDALLVEVSTDSSNRLYASGHGTRCCRKAGVCCCSKSRRATRSMTALAEATFE